MVANIDLNERLKRYPKLAKRFEALLDLVEGQDRESFNANVVEEATVAEVKKLGNQVIQDWAKTQEEWLAEEVGQQIQPVKRNGKKNFTG